MNSDELKQEFATLFPTEIDGNKRPAEPIPSNDDWYLDAPQLIAKDPVYYAKMNMYLRVLFSNERLLKQWVNALEDAMSAEDFKIVTETMKGLMSPEMFKKLNGIQANANNYVHPSAHPATMITQDATHRFATDTEKDAWNAKASTALVSTTANGLAPKRDGNAGHFFAGDGTWKAVPSASSAATATKATQDSRGQQIDTTYIKGVAGSNAVLTITKGNGTTSQITINNVANATKAGSATNATNATSASTAARIGTNIGTSASTLGSALPYGLSFAQIYNNGYPCAYGNVISIRGAGAVQLAIEWTGKDATPGRMYFRNARDSSIDKWSGWREVAYTAGSIASATKATNDGSNRNIVNTYATKASPAFSGTPTSPTPVTTDNSTKIATTAFVRNIINQFKADGTLGGIVGGNLAQNGWVKFSNGLILQWGDWVNGKNVFPIAYTKFYKIASCGEYSWDARDNAIGSLAKLEYFTASKKSNFTTTYIAIGV